MNGHPLRYGIPDLKLPLRSGGTLNPSDFAGHQLVVVFCPLDPARSASELKDYERHSKQFSDCDSWLVTIGESSDAACAELACAADDADGNAWTAFANLSESPTNLERQEGAAFIFGRGGALQRVLPGSGHAAHVVQELERRR